MWSTQPKRVSAELTFAGREHARGRSHTAVQYTLEERGRARDATLRLTLYMTGLTCFVHSRHFVHHYNRRINCKATCESTDGKKSAPRELLGYLCTDVDGVDVYSALYLICR